MAAIVQKGTACKIGYGGITWTGYVLQNASIEGTGTQKELFDTDNATMTVLVENLGLRYSLEVMILNTVNLVNLPAQGDTFTLTTDFDMGTTPASAELKLRIESISIALTAEEARLSLTVIKEVSMTYT